MRRLAIALVLHAALCAQAAELSRDDVCEAWARNATLGAWHAMHGHARNLMPIAETYLGELVEHGGLYDLDDIPVLDEHYATTSGRQFLEDSIFYGYDFAKQLPESDRPGDYDELFLEFQTVCGKREVSYTR